ncbi:hypothetical protein MAR_031584 [Mya arenaria]|uniref:Uncharacterized protein n=1 Tax=Mya arenaria TaxID=6604 RepID=A0ABY7F599_MYAAR|nr:hypothetical protein MAR_031584 [Mya arenaria]
MGDDAAINLKYIYNSIWTVNVDDELLPIMPMETENLVFKDALKSHQTVFVRVGFRMAYPTPDSYFGAHTQLSGVQRKGFEELFGEIHELKETIKNIRTERDSLKEETIRFEAECQYQRSKVEQLLQTDEDNNEKIRLTTENESLRKERDRCESRIAELAKAITTENKSLHQTHREEREKCESRIAELVKAITTENKSLHQTHREEREKCESRIAELVKAITTENKSLHQTFRAESEKYESRTAELAIAHQTLREEREEYESRISELAAKAHQTLCEERKKYERRIAKLAKASIEMTADMVISLIDVLREYDIANV